VTGDQENLSTNRDTEHHMANHTTRISIISAQNPDFYPFLEENGFHPGQFTHVSEPSLPDVEAPSAMLPSRTLSRSDIGRTTEAVSVRRERLPVRTDSAAPNCPACTRPETHQNLIHPDKEQTR